VAAAFSRTYLHPVVETGIQAIWEETAVSPFNELIISWNALRPQSGKYRIEASIKSEGAWSPWILYAEWGAKDQKTFTSKPAKSAAFSYQDCISLEEGRLADGFRIRVECFSHATLEHFHTLFA